VTVSLAIAGPQATGGAGTDTLTHFENLVGSPFADVLTGNGGDNVITGAEGNDILIAGTGEDALIGVEGNDVLYFGPNFSAGDFALGGDGRDALVLQGNVTLVLGEFALSETESISLQTGANATFGDTANNFYDYNITTADGNVAANHQPEQLIVNAQSLRAGEDFTFDGSAEHDGKFLVYGGHGVDILKGGDGVDVFFFEGQRWGANDRVDGGGGRDAIVISAGSGLTHIQFGANALTSIESISVNKLYASDPTQLPSYEFILDNGNVAAGGTLIVNASSLANTTQTISIDGRAIHDGNLILFGGAGNDTIMAGDGADLIIGGGLSDTLFGGPGADTFRYDAASNSTAAAPDLIGDFTSGTDKFDLSRIDANTNAAGDQAFTWIGGAAFNGVAGELRSYNQNGYIWVEGDTDGDGDGDLVITLHLGTVALVHGDFLL
jgi:Ca2+-binding RTX toxin-like protein